MIEAIISAFTIIGAVVTAATSIVIVLEKVAEITPTTKDDEAVASAKKFLSKVSAVLDHMNVYTTKDKK